MSPRLIDVRDRKVEVQVQRAVARVLGVQLHLPRLAQRVRLDEVSFIVNVKAVINRVVLKVGDETGHIYCCH